MLKDEIKERVRRRTVEDLMIERDGSECFYCGKAFTAERPATLEHLVAIAEGGNNHLSNLALADESCNRQADSLPVVAKVRLRDSLRRAG